MSRPKQRRANPRRTDAEAIAEFRTLLATPDAASLAVAIDMLLENGLTLEQASHDPDSPEIRSVETFRGKITRFHGGPVSSEYGVFKLTTTMWVVWVVDHLDVKLPTWRPTLYLCHFGQTWGESGSGPFMFVVMNSLTQPFDFMPVLAARDLVALAPWTAGDQNTRDAAMYLAITQAWRAIETFVLMPSASTLEVIDALRMSYMSNLPREVVNAAPAPPAPLAANPSTRTKSAAWVTGTLASSFDAIGEIAPAAWLPKISDVRAGHKSRVTAAFTQYGCGMYGCVLPTFDKAIVLKITTDESEAKFAAELAATLIAPICVTYEMVASLEVGGKPVTHDGRKVFALWRESADEVGELEKVAGDDVAQLVDDQHLIAQQVYMAWRTQRPHRELEKHLRAWEVATRKMAANHHLMTLASGLLQVYAEQGIFFGDIHVGNLGLVWRGQVGSWVITDPGHVVVIR